MSLINDLEVSISASINIDQAGLTAGYTCASARFLANVGSLMVRCLPFFILSFFGISGPPRGGKS